jgi:uncharacterized membrane protein
MVFSNSCNPSPSSLNDFSQTPTLKLSTKLETTLLKNGLLSPTIIADQSPKIRKEFYSIINENSITKEELNLTKNKLNISLKTENEKEKELEEMKEKVSNLQEKLKNKIIEINESQNEINKYLKELKCKEDENKVLKDLILDLKNSLGKFKSEVNSVKNETVSDLKDLTEIVNKSEVELKFTISKLIENNNQETICNVEFVTNKDAEIEDDSESLHNSSTVSENSQTSNYCFKPNSPYPLQLQPSTPKSQTKIIPTWLLIISAIIFFLSLWIKINGSLFGQQPHLQVYYTSIPPS